MDKRKSILNVGISLISRFFLLIAAFYVRRLLIHYIGIDINGLNSLYTSIIGILTVTEFGIGSAIVYSMYKPIVDGDIRKLAALYYLYRKLYRIIGLLIFIAGLIVMPFLPMLINDYENLNVNIYFTFFLTLISVVPSYMYSAKTALIEAHKDNYLTAIILTIAKMIRYSLQIITILIWKSFAIFLLCQLIDTLLTWGMTEVIVQRKYSKIIMIHETVDIETRYEIIRNVKAMFMHKIGTILVNTIDNVIISGFIGVVALGIYSNYALVAGVVAGTLSLFFSPLTSVVGHLCAAGNQNKTEDYFNYFYSLNYILGVVFYLGYFAVIDNVIALCFGPSLKVSRIIAFIITMNQFTQYMRSTTLLFRNASGTFYYDRWKPIAEGLCNLLLSLGFVTVLPDNYRLVGVLVATIITTLLICDIVDPYVVFRHAFGKTPWQFCLKNYSYIALFTLALLAMTYLTQTFDNTIIGIMVNGSISVVISLISLSLVATYDKDFRFRVQTMFRKHCG